MENQNNIMVNIRQGHDFNETWMLTQKQLNLLSALEDESLLADDFEWTIIEERNIRIV